MAMSSRSDVDRDEVKTGRVKMIAAVALILLGVLLVAYELRPQPNIAGNFTQGYFTDDDGATYFVDDLTQTPPFDHNGKPAVRARVFQADNGSKFVGYLERYNANAHAVLVDANAKHKAGQLPEEAYHMIVGNAGIQQHGLEAKLPGAGQQWVPLEDFRIDQVKSPADNSRGIELSP